MNRPPLLITSALIPLRQRAGTRQRTARLQKGSAEAILECIRIPEERRTWSNETTYYAVVEAKGQRDWYTLMSRLLKEAQQCCLVVQSANFIGHCARLPHIATVHGVWDSDVRRVMMLQRWAASLKTLHVAPDLWLTIVQAIRATERLRLPASLSEAQCKQMVRAVVAEHGRLGAA